MYEIREQGKVIGSSKLEHGDPPMGFAHGQLVSINGFVGGDEDSEFSVVHIETSEKLICNSVVIEVYEELQEMYVTIQVESSDEYEKYFYHHREAYDKRFGQNES